MTIISSYHVPVMLHPSVDALDLQPGGTYVDVTFGGGGHSREILRRMDAGAHLYSFDQDADAERNIPQGDSRFTFVRSNFRFLANWMRYYGVEAVDGILSGDTDKTALWNVNTEKSYHESKEEKK